MKSKLWQCLLGAVLIVGIVGGTATALALDGGEGGDDYPCEYETP